MHFWHGESNQLTRRRTTGFSRADGTEGGIHSGDRQFCENMFDQSPQRSESRNASAATRFVIRIRRCCEVWTLNSKSMQELLRHSTLRSTLDVYTEAITPAKHAAQAAVLSLIFSPETSGTPQPLSSPEAAA